MKCPHCATATHAPGVSGRSSPAQTWPVQPGCTKSSSNWSSGAPRRGCVASSTLCVNAHNKTPPPSSAAEVDESAKQRQWTPYLDSLRGLAFHLVRHRGGLIHVGAPTVGLSTETRAAVGCGFFVCCALASAQPHLTTVLYSTELTLCPVGVRSKGSW